MKLTRKLFDQAAKKGANDNCVGNILLRATDKTWEYITFPYTSYILTDEDKATSKEIIQDIIKEYGFEDPAEDFTYSVNKTKKTYNLRRYYIEYFGDDLYLTLEKSGFPEELYYTQESLETAIKIMDRWLAFVVPLINEVKEDVRFVSLLLQDKRNGAFSEVSVPLGSKLNIDVTKNYMPDLPNDSIKEKLSEDRGGIMIFHGEPGTGKSSYIKYLMESMPNADFVVLDPNTIQNFSEDFKNYLIQNSLSKKFYREEPVGDSCDEISGHNREYGKGLQLAEVSCGGSSFSGKIYVLEDAEKLLLKRNETTNPVNLSNILNITDGIVGDLVKTKFICTFNCDLSEIDSALLRKGRLLQKYEFKALTGETLDALAKELGLPEDHPKSMTLAEIYGYTESTGMDETEKHKIGF
jgi:hypothetical protein